MDAISFAKNTAQKAGEIVKSYYGKAKSYDKPGRMNFITDADLASNKFIEEEIKKNFPNHQILSEEDKIHEMKNAENLWIVDPLDGTTNFKFGIPLFCVSIAYVENGEVNIGAVYDPNHDELFWAEKGKGAFLNGQKLKIDDQWSLQNAVIALDGNYELNKMKGKLEIILKLDQYPATLRLLGSAVLGISYLAANRINLYFENYVYPWDIAASSLIVQEAGGKVLEYNKQPFNLFTQGIIAGSPSLLSEFTNLI